MSSYSLSLVWGAGAQIFDNNGEPLAGGKIFVYEAGTTTPATTYTTPSGGVPNTNPILTNAAGRLENEIWLEVGKSYKFIVKTADNTEIGSYDNIPSSPQPPIINDASSVSYNAGYVVTAGSFTVGETYLITAVGTTNFMAIGAASNTIGLFFTATGVGSGTGTAAFIRTVQEKLRDEYNVKDFGAVGDGLVDDTAAFNAAIAFANAKGGTDRANALGTTIYIPDGRYRITAALNPVTVSYVLFSGSGVGGCTLVLPTATNAFTFKGIPGGYTVVGGGIQNVKIEYASDPTGGSVAFIDYAFQLSFSNITFERCGTFLRLGETSARVAGGISVTNIAGSTANSGLPFFHVRYGAGLFVDNCRVFVRGVVAPINPNPMTTVPGTIAFNCGSGFWDTLQVTNSVFERFDVGFSIDAGAGVVVQNIFFDNTIFDYCRRFGFYLNASGVGAAISCVRVGPTCWYNSWEESSVFMNNNGGYLDNCHFSGVCAISGLYSVYYNIANALNNSFTDLIVNGANRLGTVNSCLQFQSNSTGFTVQNIKGNNDPSVGWVRPSYGIVVNADCDRYTVTNCALYGPIGGYSVATNTSGSKNRRFSNNINAGYAVTSIVAVPASTVRYTNTTPFVEEWQFFGGTITGGYDKNGIGLPGALPYVTFTLQPGETYAVGYSVAPQARKSLAP